MVDEKTRKMWLAIRQGLIFIVNAISDYVGVAKVSAQKEGKL